LISCLTFKCGWCKVFYMSRLTDLNNAVLELADMVQDEPSLDRMIRDLRTEADLTEIPRNDTALGHVLEHARGCELTLACMLRTRAEALQLSIGALVDLVCSELDDRARPIVLEDVTRLVERELLTLEGRGEFHRKATELRDSYDGVSTVHYRLWAAVARAAEAAVSHWRPGGRK
jgi:hypothetical protein